VFFWWFYNTHHFAVFRSNFAPRRTIVWGCLGAEFYNLEPKKMTWELFFDPGIFLEFISHHFIPNAKLSPASNVFDQIQLSLGTFFVLSPAIMQV